MKKTLLTQSKLFLCLLNIVAITTVISPAFAQRGNGAGNGGDGMEAAFVDYREKIKDWIEATGLKMLDLQGRDPQIVSTKTLQAIEKGSITFVDSALKIGDSIKTCINFPATAKIVCNRLRFQQESTATRFQLVFHEYLGIAGFESNQGANSIYPISRQIVDYLESQRVHKLSPFKVLRSSNSICNVIAQKKKQLEAQKKNLAKHVAATKDLNHRLSNAWDNAGVAKWISIPAMTFAYLHSAKPNYIKSLTYLGGFAWIIYTKKNAEALQELLVANQKNIADQQAAIQIQYNSILKMQETASCE